jgi:thioredoxin-like negative regulator of GroEL
MNERSGDRMNAQTMQVTGEDWEKEVLQSPVPVLVDFGTSWCGDC